ncbi:G5 and 3D domain-containing protein [Lederbergia panacisoli]|uniref:G5 and 3D domain-containing protein n=1 Tax=Lederbergia panacisoli TaxID=1255251 RepID=UPI00214B25FA|nr:G5 and 3D domain-containing protein [Lederbergia panacisoli]MCR2823368.1 ubiquitin-like domain-containing protein [Lederbergia panacisoli]
MNTKPAIYSYFSSITRKKLGLFIASFLVFIATLTILVYEGTKNTVALSVDGEKMIVKTHAETIGEILKDLNVVVDEDDYISHSLNTVVQNKLNVVWEPAKKVEIKDGKHTEYVYTTAKTVKEFMESQRLDINNHDKINFDLEDPIYENLKLVIDRAFPLVLKNGKQEEKVWSTSTTVADFLLQQGITLGKFDRVEPGLKKKVKPNGKVKIVRVEKVTDVVEEPIDYAVITKKDSNLAQGTEKVIQSGQEGLMKKEYEVTKENGKEVKRKLMAETKVKNSINKIVTVGTKVMVAQVSRGKSVSANSDTPSGGKEMYMNATAYTAYCNGCSGITATGINLRANPNLKVIAVDPRVIPLGSKVWVEGYGYAVAGDTGGAIKGNRIDIFVASKEEAYRFGRRQVKIRVLN